MDKLRGIPTLEDQSKREANFIDDNIDFATNIDRRQNYYEPQIRQKVEELSNIRIHTQVPDKGEMAARAIAGFYSLLGIGFDDNLEECK